MPTSDTALLAKLVKDMQRREEDPFTALLDEYLLTRHLSENRIHEYQVPFLPRHRPGGRLSPSSLCGCEREAVMKFAGVEGVLRINPDTQLIFDDGDWRHHRWQATFLDMQAVLGRKRFRVMEIEGPSVIEDLYVAGHLDAHIAIDRIPWVIDFKGINSYGFQDIYRNGPKKLHVKQLLAYMRAKRRRRGFLLYENKNDQKTKCYTVIFDREQWGEVSDWCDRVLGKLENHELPKRDPECHNGTFTYDKCKFSELCFGKKFKDNSRGLERVVFENFEGVEAAWKRGFVEIAKAEERG